MAAGQVAYIFGAGSGLSAALARRFAREGLRVALAARQTDKLLGLARDIDAKTFACDVAQPAAVEACFADAAAALGEPDIVVFNPSARARGPIAELDPTEVERGWLVSC